MKIATKIRGITQGYYYAVPCELIEDTTISPKSRFLFCVLASMARKDKDGFCRAPNWWLAKKIGTSDPNHVSTLLTELKKKDWIDIITPGSKYRKILLKFTKSRLSKVQEYPIQKSTGLTNKSYQSSINNINNNNDYSFGTFLKKSTQHNTADENKFFNSFLKEPGKANIDGGGVSGILSELEGDEVI